MLARRAGGRAVPSPQLWAAAKQGQWPADRDRGLVRRRRAVLDNHELPVRRPAGLFCTPTKLILRCCCCCWHVHVHVSRMHRRLSKICGAYTSALSEAEMWVPDVASGDIPMADGSYWQVPSPQCWRFWSESWEGTPTQSHKPTDPDCDGIVLHAGGQGVPGHGALRV